MGSKRFGLITAIFLVSASATAIAILFPHPLVMSSPTAAPAATGTSRSVGFADPSPVTSSEDAEATSSLEWRSFQSDEYGFNFSYPPNFIVSHNCDIMSASLISNSGVCVANITSVRTIGPAEQELATLILTIYDNPNSLTLRQWLAQSLPEIQHTHPGNIEDVLQTAYANPQKTEFITQAVGQTGKVTSDGIGAIIDGALSYTTFITSSSRPRSIYSLEMYLQADEEARTPNDEWYVDAYNEVISTFAFAD